jgi:predicted RecB family nuclease
MRICNNGHSYYKSSDCPVCPYCEAEHKPKIGFLSMISAPARRALEGKGITTLKKLSQFSVDEIMELHGIGKTTIPILKAELRSEKRSFKK